MRPSCDLQVAGLPRRPGGRALLVVTGKDSSDRFRERTFYCERPLLPRPPVSAFLA
jgi:hypothetical protein